MKRNGTARTSVISEETVGAWRWTRGIPTATSGNFTGRWRKRAFPLPELTVLTHWHWDHTFGMHAIHGLSLANERTNRYLADFRGRLDKEGPGFFLDMHESIRREYDGGKPVVVTLADLLFRGEMQLDAGNCPIRVSQAEAPHTDDSTLVFLPEEKCLILGDCTGGTFPDWTMIPYMTKMRSIKGCGSIMMGNRLFYVPYQLLAEAQNVVEELFYTHEEDAENDPPVEGMLKGEEAEIFEPEEIDDLESFVPEQMTLEELTRFKKKLDATLKAMKIQERLNRERMDLLRDMIDETDFTIEDKS